MKQTLYKARLSLTLAGSLVALAFAATQSRANIISWDGSGANDSVNWGSLGAPYTPVPDNPFTISSAGGIHLQVGMPTGNFERDNEGEGWTGNFQPGAKLLWTAYNPGPVTIGFGGSVTAIGAQIQRDVYGAFTTVFNAYDSGHTLLGSWTFTGDSTDAADNSAIFAGIKSSSDIAWLTIEVSGANEPNFTGFALGQLSLIGTHGVPDATPYAWVALFAVLGVSCFLQRKTAKA